ncbi:MAG: hypothetical protein IJT94_13570 [Oscillibacter sp.]|nr:hypothetical protein [Oscillibacter sp.]
MEECKAYYFTYGSEGQPFRGGWTAVYAPDKETACALFRIFHPNKDGFLNCCTVYSAEEFQNTSIYRYGNLGAHLHERISFQREVYTEEEKPPPGELDQTAAGAE